jgi:hypothetical protein
MTDEPAPLERLSPLVGEWRLESSLAPPSVRATTLIEWGPGRGFLVQRTEVDHPEAPDSLCVIVADGDRYTQHYFDSRGVARLYAMTFDDDLWTLVREAPDFTPLEFAQRFTGEVQDGGAVIRGRWETRHPDRADWQPDFDLTYVRGPAVTGR